MCGIVRELTACVLVVVPHGLFWEISVNLRSAFGEEPLARNRKI